MRKLWDFLNQYAGYEFIRHRYEDTSNRGSDYYYYDMLRKSFSPSHTKNSYSVMFVMDAELKRRWDYQQNGDFHSFWFHRSKHYVKPTELPFKIYDLKWDEFIKFIKENHPSFIYDELMRDSDPDYFTNIHAEWNSHKQERLARVDSLPLASLSYSKCDIAHLCAMLNYKLEDTIKACEFTECDEFYELSTGKLVNNRLWIPIDDDRYFVISKNPADAVWASTGNEFTSCYSLDGDSHAIQSSLACMTQIPWFYMAYITDGTTKEYTLFRKKWQLPQMDWRCWCYLTKDGEYVLDRRFGKDGTYDSAQKIFAEILNAVPLKNVLYKFEKDQKITLNIDTEDYYKLTGRYKCYWDSICPRVNTDDYNHLYFKFMHLYQYSCNSGLDKREVHRANVDYNPDLDYKKQITLTDKIYNPVYSEKSQMMCASGKHWVDKYLERPVKTCVIVTFLDGQLMHHALTGSHVIGDEWVYNKIIFKGCNKHRDCRKFVTDQELLNPKLYIDNARAWIKSSDNIFWDCIVVRVITDNEVKITPMYAKQNQEIGNYERLT